MMQKYIVSDINELDSAAKWLLKKANNNKLFAFYGDMGVGKTTLIKALCQQLGSLDVATSPTFALVNEYHTNDDKLLYHFDFYRIKSKEEALDFGLEEYLSYDDYCFMEWPEKVEELLPENIIKVNISAKSDGSRIIKIDVL